MSEQKLVLPNDATIRKALVAVLPPSHADLDTLYNRMSEALSGREVTGQQYIALWVVAIKGIWQVDHFMIWYVIECGWLSAWTQAVLDISGWSPEDRSLWRDQSIGEILEIKNSWRADHL